MQKQQSHLVATPPQWPIPPIFAEYAVPKNDHRPAFWGILSPPTQWQWVASWRWWHVLLIHMDKKLVTAKNPITDHQRFHPMLMVTFFANQISILYLFNKGS